MRISPGRRSLQHLNIQNCRRGVGLLKPARWMRGEMLHRANRLRNSSPDPSTPFTLDEIAELIPVRYIREKIPPDGWQVAISFKDLNVRYGVILQPGGSVEVLQGEHPSQPNLAFEINSIPFRQWFSGSRTIMSLGMGCGLNVTLGATGLMGVGNVLKFAECFRTGRDILE